VALAAAAAAAVAEEPGGMAKDRIPLAVVLPPNPEGLRTDPYASLYSRIPALQTMSQSSVSGLGPNPSPSGFAIYEYAVDLQLIERRPLLRVLKVFLGADRGGELY
jgi:hypothetical protein